MALERISPLPARVRWDRAKAEPASVRLPNRDLTVTALKAVRDEMAAFPAARGPRITFLVETDAGDASLVYDGRRRRWYVEAIDRAA